MYGHKIGQGILDIIFHSLQCNLMKGLQGEMDKVQTLHLDSYSVTSYDAFRE